MLESMSKKILKKGIIIGKRGSKLKDIGTRARLEIEPWFEKVLLHLFVAVERNGRKIQKTLKI